VSRPLTTRAASLPAVRNVATNNYIAHDPRAAGEQFIDDLYEAPVPSSPTTSASAGARRRSS